jgi:hypothetical protein
MLLSTEPITDCAHPPIEVGCTPTSASILRKRMKSCLSNAMNTSDAAKLTTQELTCYNQGKFLVSTAWHLPLLVRLMQ